MNDFGRRGALLSERRKRRSGGSRFGDLGDRFARAFSADRAEFSREPEPDPNFPFDAEQAMTWDEVALRFPVTRHGYDCEVVDEHVSELERELMELEREVTELRASRSAKSEVAAEIEKIGEQTSAILVAAHDQAQQTTRLAQEQADRCITEATQNAVAITADANRQLRDLEVRSNTVRAQHARLIEDIHKLAATLVSVAQAASEQVPQSGGETQPIQLPQAVVEGITVEVPAEG